MGKVLIVENKGIPHSLTQSDGNTFRLTAHGSKEIDESLLSFEFYSQKDKGSILIIPVVVATKKEEKRNLKKEGNK